MEKYGEKAVEAAPAWLEYGSALLRKVHPFSVHGPGLRLSNAYISFHQQEEENPSDDLLGAATAEAKKQAKALSAELGGAAPDTDGECYSSRMGHGIPTYLAAYTEHW